ncbi:MAG TPA: hypothetical protein VEH84_15505 [Alphaproteobacteria bacterium]|nr:hypothetical protein [Alphaproteobacteria bacterium]
MPRTRKSDPLPLIATGLRTGETALAAGQVIGARLTLMAAAMADPRGADWLEFHRMVAEKAEAAAEWQAAAVANWLHIGGVATLAAVEQGRAALGALGGAALGWPAASLAAGLAAGEQAAAAAARLAADGLDPYHSRATANARRLRRRR